MSEWLCVAFERRIVARGLKFAIVVGALLIAINHGDALLAGRIDRGRLLKMALTVVVPYLVSTFSSVGATLEHRRGADRDASRGRAPAREGGTAAGSDTDR